MAVALLGRLLCVAVLVSSSSAQDVPSNVALNKPASQSSTFDGTDGTLTFRASANLAVDGAPTKSYPDKTCAVTDWQNDRECTDNPWWQVDLGGLYDVFNVTIYQRGERETNVNNYGPLVVRLGDYEERPENRTVYGDRPVIFISLSPPVTASTVNISITRCSLLQMCEVEVFAVTHVDKCANNPCQHGGSCTDGLFNHSCACVPGYIGMNCEIDIDDCASSPCQNGATCQDNVNFYNCMCAAGFTGRLCEEDINECGSSPCSHNSLCVDGINNYTCYCAPGYTGFECLWPCSGGTYGPGCSVACSAHCPETSDRGGQHCDRTTGQCLLQTGCKDGFQGLQCDTKQQPCLSSSAERRCTGDIQLSPRQMQEVTRRQEVAPGQEGGFYESLDDASKDQGRSGPYAELGEARVGQDTDSPYNNVSA